MEGINARVGRHAWSHDKRIQQIRQERRARPRSMWRLIQSCECRKKYADVGNGSHDETILVPNKFGKRSVQWKVTALGMKPRSTFVLSFSMSDVREALMLPNAHSPSAR